MFPSKANGLLDGCNVFFWLFLPKRAAARDETDFPRRATSFAAALVSHKVKKKMLGIVRIPVTVLHN